MFPLVGYVLLFVVIGVGFILIHLLIGKLVRPNRPHAEKATIYECGEPTIGSAWVQFDLRFYVVALLFVIFDVEVAFFFPWAVVFGKANAVAQQSKTSAEMTAEERQAYDANVRGLIPNYKENEKLRKLYPEGENALTPEQQKAHEIAVAKNQKDAQKLGWLAFWDILLFFGILLVGFAYLWRRGDLAWVRSISSETATPLQSVVKTEKQPLVGAGSGS
jgi:NADH-quinone oxidoreductase subunit A